MLGADDARRSIVGMLSGLDIRYDLDPSGDAHPLVGRRMPDLDLEHVSGSTRVFDLLHDGRFVLVNFGEPGAVRAAESARRVRLVDASTRGPWELPSVGAVEAPAAVLIRPDGHVAWAGDPGDRCLLDAMATYGIRLAPSTAYDQRPSLPERDR